MSPAGVSPKPSKGDKKIAVEVEHAGIFTIAYQTFYANKHEKES